MIKQRLVKYRVPLISLVLAVVTFMAFEQVRYNGFVSWDDEEYVTENPNVNQGLSSESIVWAFISGYAANWHPLTWLSHMVDCEFYGLRPAGHHITNLLLHIVNTLLLFWVFKKMTTCLWPSAFVAALFALHPLHVESVAWASERKDVLSTLFWLLTMIAYVRYAERSGMGNYVLVALMFCLGLMAKPMLVTLPFILLLLDYWPLRRFDESSIRRLVGEKIPLLILAAGSSVITFLVQQEGGAVAELEIIPLTSRLGNALLSYVGYMGKMIYPGGLAMLYPYPMEGVGLWKPLLSAALLAGITLFFVRLAGKRRYPLVGWLWYLVTLVPVIGIVQVGSQAMADRYTYVPSIGFFMVIALGLSDLLSRWKHKKVILSASALIVIVLATLGTRDQVLHWRNNITLFEHTLNVTEDNYMIHTNYGKALGLDDRLYEALHHCQKAAILNPDFAFAHYNLGITLAVMGDFALAIEHYQKALELEPEYADAHNMLGAELAKTGKLEEAIDHCQQALKLKPDYADAHCNFGIALADMGNFEQAIEQFRKSLQIEPGMARAYYNLGDVFRRTGKYDEAVRHFQSVLELNPDSTHAHINLGGVFGESGNLEQAIDHFQQALELDPDYTDAHHNLGMVLEKTGNLAQAIKHYERALESDPGYFGAHNSLGMVLWATGNLEKAIEHFQQALELCPDSTDAHYNLGIALVALGKSEQATGYFQQALQLNPDYAIAHYQLAISLFTQDKIADAIGHLQDALRLQPDGIQYQNTLAWILATAADENLRDPTEAVRLVERACELTRYARPEVLDTLAVACAAAGDFPRAIEIAEKALSLAADNVALTREIRERLEGYEANRPYYEK